MTSTIKKCRICGKEYEACRSANRNAGVFRWQEVACSPECGSVYLQKIEESRGHISTKKERRKKVSENNFDNTTIDDSIITASNELNTYPHMHTKKTVENE